MLLQEIAVATPTLAVDQQSTAGREQGLMQLDRYEHNEREAGKEEAFRLFDSNDCIGIMRPSPGPNFLMNLSVMIDVLHQFIFFM